MRTIKMVITVFSVLFLTSLSYASEGSGKLSIPAHIRQNGNDESFVQFSEGLLNVVRSKRKVNEPITPDFVTQIRQAMDMRELGPNTPEAVIIRQWVAGNAEHPLERVDFENLFTQLPKLVANKGGENERTLWTIYSKEIGDNFTLSNSFSFFRELWNLREKQSQALFVKRQEEMKAALKETEIVAINPKSNDHRLTTVETENGNRVVKMNQVLTAIQQLPKDEKIQDRERFYNAWLKKNNRLKVTMIKDELHKEKPNFSLIFNPFYNLRSNVYFFAGSTMKEEAAQELAHIHGMIKDIKALIRRENPEMAALISRNSFYSAKPKQCEDYVWDACQPVNDKKEDDFLQMTEYRAHQKARVALKCAPWQRIVQRLIDQRKGADKKNR